MCRSRIPTAGYIRPVLQTQNRQALRAFAHRWGCSQALNPDGRYFLNAASWVRPRFKRRWALPLPPATCSSLSAAWCTFPGRPGCSTPKSYWLSPESSALPSTQVCWDAWATTWDRFPTCRAWSVAPYCKSRHPPRESTLSRLSLLSSGSCPDKRWQMLPG